MQRADGPTLIFASEGVYFAMVDQHKHPVRFIVTRGALARLMGRPITIPEAEDAFYAIGLRSRPREATGADR
jgi:hypothetical protein